jgi:hypothetical protein
MKNIFLQKAAVAVFLAASFLVGCDKENEPKPTTVEEDKANIQASFDRVKNLIRNFHDGSMYSFVDNFLDIHDETKTETRYYYEYAGDGQSDYTFIGRMIYSPGKGDHAAGVNYWPVSGGSGNYTFNDETGQYVLTPGSGDWDTDYRYVGEGKGDFTYVDYEYTPGRGDYTRVEYTWEDTETEISDFARQLGEELDKLVNFEQIGDQNRFSMAAFRGKYEWNNSASQWAKTDLNNIRVLFPSAASGTANNCEFSVTEYADVSCDIEGTATYLPVKIVADFKKDGEKIAGIKAVGDFTSYGIPKNVSAEAYAKPLTLNASLTQASASKYSASLSIDDETDSNNSLAIEGEATLSQAVNNYTDFSDCEINNLKLKVTQADLSIEGTVDVKTLDGMDDPGVADINRCINFEVFYKGAKTGTLRVQEVGGDRYLYIVYKDETSENTEIYYDSFITDVENMFKK